MVLIVSSSRSTILTLRYVERKPDGSFQYRRRIPEVLRSRYGGKRFFVRSLKRDENRLVQSVSLITDQLDAIWLRLKADVDLNTEVYQDLQQQLSSVSKTPIHSTFSQNTIATQPNKHTSLTNGMIQHPTMSEALKLYLSMHKKGSDPKFIADNSRAIRKLIERIGDLNLDSYTRFQAEDYRDSLLRSHPSGTVRRRLRMICAIVNKTMKEKHLQMLNPFEGLGIAGEGEDETKRIPFTSHELEVLSLACRSLDDDIRHIVAFQLDTGSRVAEIVGLRLDDVILEGPIPYVRIRPFGKIRTLKTAASQRDIPLVGEALWAAGRAVEARRKAGDASPWLFPRYASDKEIKATHASNTLNKWLRSLTGVCDKKTTHCFRHAMRDRLRAAQVPMEIQDCLGGWGSRSIGQGYGSGYPLTVLLEHMRRIINLNGRSE